MKRNYLIEGLADNCPLCLPGDEPREGKKEKRPPVFVVSCEGGYCGPCCAPHLAALMKAAETSTVKTARPVEARQPEMKEAKVEAKVVNGPVHAVPVVPK